MGFGDCLIAAALAQEAFALSPERGPVAICNCDGTPRWRPEWAGNPAIRQSNDPSPAGNSIRVGGGCLPYHPWNREMAWQARDHRATLYLTDEEITLGLKVRAQYGPFVLIEPTGTDRKNTNRRWSGWPALARLLRDSLDLPVVQLDRPAAWRLPGIPGIPHKSFREACAILKAAELGVLTEGGITVGAATVGTPAVVLWGGCVSVETFGYPEHVNITGEEPQQPCGSSRPCAHCAAAWAQITPERVAASVTAALRAVQFGRRTA